MCTKGTGDGTRCAEGEEEEEDAVPPTSLEAARESADTSAGCRRSLVAVDGGEETAREVGKEEVGGPSTDWKIRYPER